MDKTSDPARPRRLARKLAVAVLGSTVLVCGLVLIVLPGPSILVIPLGLAILGQEFAWARRLLSHLKALTKRWLPHRGPPIGRPR